MEGIVTYVSKAKCRQAILSVTSSVQLWDQRVLLLVLTNQGMYILDLIVLTALLQGLRQQLVVLGRCDPSAEPQDELSPKPAFAN